MKPLYGWWVIVVFGLLLCGKATAGSLKDGQAAFERAEYATSLALLKPLAEQGS